MACTLNLILAGFVGLVRHPFPVWRKLHLDLIEVRLQVWCGLPIPIERQKPQVEAGLRPVLKNDQPAVRRPIFWEWDRAFLATSTGIGWHSVSVQRAGMISDALSRRLETISMGSLK
jgi:hypothetical protein